MFMRHQPCEHVVLHLCIFEKQYPVCFDADMRLYNPETAQGSGRKLAARTVGIEEGLPELPSWTFLLKVHQHPQQIALSIEDLAGHALGQPRAALNCRT